MPRPREYPDGRITKALRISPELDDQLKRAAQERGISVNVLINAAVADYLGRLIPLEQLLQTA